MSMLGDDGKQSKREAKQLWEQARAAFGVGNYRLARSLDVKIAELTPGTDLGEQAKREAAALAVDPVAIQVGLGATALLAVAWVYALW